MENSSTPEKLIPTFKKQRLFKSSPSPRNAFKSPLLQVNTSPFIKADASVDELKIAVEDMWKKNEMLKTEIDDLEKHGYKEDELNWFIEKMHIYNDMKDAAQLVMGRIAMLEGTTVKTVHEEFGLNEED